MQKTAIALAATFILSACMDGAPKCDSTEVKNQATTLATQLIRDELLHQYVVRIPPLTYEEAKKSELPHHREAAELVDKQLAENGFELAAIRPVSEDGKTRKCTCAATLAFKKGNTLGVDYSAQYTTDGKIYVEVGVK